MMWFFFCYDVVYFFVVFLFVICDEIFIPRLKSLQDSPHIHDKGGMMH